MKVGGKVFFYEVFALWQNFFLNFPANLAGDPTVVFHKMIQISIVSVDIRVVMEYLAYMKEWWSWL
jgi:hypothetical protein